MAESSARKSLLLYLTAMGNSLIGFVSTFVVAHLMGPGVLGTVGFLLGLLGLISLFSDLGFSMAHRKRASEGDDIADLIGTYTAISLVLALLVVVSVVAVPRISEYFGKNLFNSSDERVAYYILSTTFVLNVLNRPMTVTFQARQELAKVSVCLSLPSLVSAVAKIIVAFSGFGLVGLAVAFLLEPLTQTVTALVLFRSYPVGRPSWARALDYASYASPVAVNSILASVYGSADRVILGNFAGEVQVGYYVGVLGVTYIVGKVAGAAMGVFFPRTSRDVARGELKRVRERLFAAQKYLMIVIIPMVVLVICFSSFIVHITLGRQFLPSARVLQVMAAGTLFRALTQPYSMLIYAVEEHASLIYINLLSCGTMVVASLILVPTELLGREMFGLGALGTSLGMLLSCLVGLVLHMRVASRRAGVGFWVNTIWYLLAGIAMYAVIQVTESLSGGSLWITLTLGSALGLASFVGFLALVREVNRTDLDFFMDMIDPRKMVSYTVSELKQ